MPKTLEDLRRLVEEQAKAAGPEALQALEDERSRSRLGAALLALRRERSLSQVQLAEASGVDQGDVSRIEAGRANPTLVTLLRVLRALDARLEVEDGRNAYAYQVLNNPVILTHGRVGGYISRVLAQEFVELQEVDAPSFEFTNDNREVVVPLRRTGS